MGDYVLVTGGTGFCDRDAVFEFLDTRPPISLLVHGDAKGVDTYADEWAKARRVSRIICPANWDGLGRVAGIWRNEMMLDLIKPIHYVIAFPGQNGTAHMVGYAEKKGVPVVHYVRWKEERKAAKLLGLSDG